jgi:hypothetical protein
MIRASGTSASARLAALTLKFGTLPPGAAAWATTPEDCCGEKKYGLRP